MERDMSLAQAENFIRNAQEQYSQRDINASLLKAIGELMREAKRLEHDLQSVRRSAKRRF